MWSYDNTDLNTTTASGRLNAVRLLVGDTDTLNQQVQDEEITFGLSQNGEGVYSTAAWVARVIASKYSRLVDVDLDGQIAESYSQLQAHYTSLADRIEAQGKLVGASIGVAAGGVSKTIMQVAEDDPDRYQPRIRRDMFTIDSALGYYEGD